MPLRNPNSMYEVGIADPSRIPEEVLLCRWDRHPLMVDLANVRVIEYGPDGDPAAARDIVGKAFASTLRDVNLL